MIKLLYSDKWATASCDDLFQAFALYVLCCATNGIAEAYIQAKADTATLFKYRNIMFITSIVYIGLSYLFAVDPGFFGFKGLIYANCLNMLMRAFTCFYSALQHKNTFKDKQAKPFCRNMIDTVMWLTLEVFAGKFYSAMTVIGIGIIIFAHKYVFPFVF